MELNTDENVRNQISMSTQEKLLMRSETSEALNINNEAKESTIAQIARDFIDLYNLEKNGIYEDSNIKRIHVEIKGTNNIYKT